MAGIMIDRVDKEEERQTKEAIEDRETKISDWEWSKERCPTEVIE
jgi:hypothetical protein